MKTKFTSVAEAAAHLAEDAAVENRVNDEIARNTVVSALLEMRIAKGLTQEQVAESMGCDPSVISRMETDSDRQLKWADIAGYVKALNVDLCLFFEDHSIPAAGRIKHLVFRIHEDLESLAELAKQVGGEDEIAKKIHQFYGEVLMNFLVKFKKSADKLSTIVKINPPSAPSHARSPKALGTPKGRGCTPTESLNK